MREASPVEDEKDAIRVNAQALACLRRALTYNSLRWYTQSSRREHQRQGGCPHVLTYEYKLDGTKKQYAAIEEAIRVVQFIRNKCLRKWMDPRGVSKNDLQC